MELSEATAAVFRGPSGGPPTLLTETLAPGVEVGVAGVQELAAEFSSTSGEGRGEIFFPAERSNLPGSSLGVSV